MCSGAVSFASRCVQALCHLSALPPTLRSFILNPSSGPRSLTTDPDSETVDLAQSSQAPHQPSQMPPPPLHRKGPFGHPTTHTGGDGNVTSQAEGVAGAAAVAGRSAAAAVAWRACPAPLALKKGLEAAYNESQLAAVASALDDSSPISLVQVCGSWVHFSFSCCLCPGVWVPDPRKSDASELKEFARVAACSFQSIQFWTNTDTQLSSTLYMTSCTPTPFHCPRPHPPLPVAQIWTE